MISPYLLLWVVLNKGSENGTLYFQAKRVNKV